MMQHTPLLLLLLSFSLSGLAQESRDVISINYPAISGSKTGKKVPFSPDPLAEYQWADPKATDGLEIYTLKPKDIQTDQAKNVSIEGDSIITVVGPCDLMFDFGQVNAAWFEFDSPDFDGEVEMSISEFNKPAVFNVGSQHPKKTAKAVKHGNTYRLELNKELYEGVRFAWIHVKALKKPMKIVSPRLICQIKPTNYQGSFDSNDTLLNRIWYTGAYTVKLNLLKDHFGAILMERSDRHSWTGDAHTSQAASMVAFGNYDFVKQNLRYTSEQYNGIPSYSLYWILSLVDYFRYTADQGLVREMLQNATTKLQKAYDQYGKEEQLMFYGWDERLGAGFENPNIKEPFNAYHMLCIRSWQEFASVLRQIGETEKAKTFQGYAHEKIAELQSSPDWWKEFGVHAAADAVNASFVDTNQEKQLWTNAFSDRMQRLSYSPFNQFFILQAMSAMERHAEAITTIDDCWGGQIRYGGTTFFEVYRPSWNLGAQPNDAPINNQCGYTSLTHPWSAGVTKWMTEEILGIKPLTPGFETFRIKPFLSSRITRVKGDVPTPKGIISFSLDSESGAIELDVPKGTKANLALPKAGQEITVLDFDGLKPTKEDDHFVYFDHIPSGNYSGKVQYQGEWTKNIQEEFRYTQQSITEDEKTSGNWTTKYGKKGHYFFNYEAVNSNDSILPTFVKNITLSRAMHVNWSPDSDDTRALFSASQKGNLGAIYTDDPNVCMQSMTIDLEGESEMSTKLSLYFVDLDKKGRTTAIEVFDLETKELLMPIHRIDTYENGKYVSFPIDRPVRIRINQVRGDNAVCSALFFD